jgi:hypothetical protein
MKTNLFAEVVMRKISILLFSALFLQACSLLDLIPRPSPPDTATPSPSPTATYTPTITLTPTRTTTPTPRNTATLIVSEFDTPVILVSEGAANPVFDPNAINSGTSLPPTGGFETVQLSRGKIFYGACKQNYTKMTVKVEHPEEVRKVYLFFRLESGKKVGDTTPWYGTVTYNDGGGYFLYTMWANHIPERKNFLRAFVHFQFVAEDSRGEIIGRSQVYTRNLVLEPCK